jgi:hypothetical protein
MGRELISYGSISVSYEILLYRKAWSKVLTLFATDDLSLSDKAFGLSSVVNA